MKLKLKHGIGGLAFDGFNYTFMILMCVTMIYPFWNMLVISFSSAKTAVFYGFRLIPSEFSLDAYAFAFSDKSMLWAYAVTIYRTVAGTLLTVVVCALGAYPLSKKHLPYRNIITTYFLIPMFFGGGLIPSYLINIKLGFEDNLLVYIIPGVFSVYNALLIRNFFMSLDKSLEEMALTEGAGYFTILFRIVMPVSMPILATIALWNMVGHWNSWFDCLIYIRSEHKVVLQRILQAILQQKQQHSVDVSGEIMDFNRLGNRQVITENLEAAITMIIVGPILVSYPWFQKYFVKGIMLGSLKG